MEPDTLALMQKIIAMPHGIILVTGPTGSGKTTTLICSANPLNNQSRNILTVEDPIEYELPGIGQTQVNYKVNMTFAKGLRAILRQDPDVVMVGEIRDHRNSTNCDSSQFNRTFSLIHVTYQQCDWCDHAFG